MKQLVALVGLTVLMAAPIASAEVSDEQFQQLQDSLNQALDRIDELEKQQTTETAPQQTTKAATKEDASVADQVAANTAKLSKMSWAERVKIQGDFRYRYQNDDVDDTVNSALPPNDPGYINENGSRNRNRIRARLAVIAQLPSDVEVGFGLASGSDDPVSANTTLGGGSDSKDVFLDLAYFDWSGLENTNIRGGKFKNTFEKVAKSQLQWDGDWRPEGMDIAWDNERFFAQALGTYLESDSNKGNSEFAYLLQAGTRLDLGPVKFVGGAGFTSIDAEGSECFYEGDDLAGLSTCLGNGAAVVAVDDGDDIYGYINDFKVYNIFASAGFDAFNQPLSFFGDYIKNSDADDYDQGYLVGFQVGKVKDAGSWQFKYYYEDIESNATLALLANSDFGGGGTNGKGSVFSAGYGLTKQSNLKLTYYLVERNSDKIAEINNGETFDFNTLQADINFKFK
jgi:hypothetical protein